MRNPLAYIYICHACLRPTFFDYSKEQFPGSMFGNDVTDITDKDVNELYNEARRCTSAKAYTATVLCCRKLLMHIAVAKGAGENKTFAEYVDYLSEKGFVPLESKEWIDHIRKMGNEANHKIAIMNQQDAENLVYFMEILLKLVFEFPAMERKKYPAKK